MTEMPAVNSRSRDPRRDLLGLGQATKAIFNTFADRLIVEGGMDHRLSLAGEGMYQTAYCRPTALSNVALAACKETAHV